MELLLSTDPFLEKDLYFISLSSPKLWTTNHLLLDRVRVMQLPQWQWSNSETQCVMYIDITREAKRKVNAENATKPSVHFMWYGQRNG